MLFQRAFTPKAIAAHERRSSEITAATMDRLEGRESCDLVADVAQPVVSRVIGSFMGLDPEDDLPWAQAINALLGFGDAGLNPKGVEGLVSEDLPRMFEKCMALVAGAAREPDRRHAQHARLRRDRRRHAHRRGDLLRLRAADGGRQRLDQGDLHGGDARADGEPRAAAAAGRRSRASCRGPSRRRCGCSRPSPTSAAPRPATPSSAAARSTRATRSLSGTRPRTGTRTATRTPTASTCSATPSIRPSAPAAATSASAPRSPGSSSGSSSPRRSSASPRCSSTASRAGSCPSSRAS